MRLFLAMTSILLAISVRAAGLIDGMPHVKTSSHTAEIAFSVKEFTDVTVEVVDSKGEVVRHLGAGLLGPHAPEPFQKNSKSQALSWDFKDDRGKPLENREILRVRIRAGLRPTFERTFGWSGQTLGIVHGMCVDEKGNLFVTARSMPITYREYTFTKVFDREGNYLRTIVPFSAELPREKLMGITFADVPDGRQVPFISNISMRQIHEDLDLTFHQQVITKSGKLILPTKSDGAARVCAIGVDGSVGEDFKGPIIAKLEDPYDNGIRNRVYPRLFLAQSPDERYLYASGVARSYSEARVDSKVGAGVAAYDNCVYRIDRQINSIATTFLGKKWSTDGLLSNPLGIDVDVSGNLYVCDYGHSRIAIFDAAGTLKQEIPFERPIQVAVHPSGKIYVYTADALPTGANKNGTKLTHKLVRLSGAEHATREIEMSWPGVSAWSQPLMSLDKHAKDPIIWMGSFSGYGAWFWHKGDLHKVIDRGSTFEDLGDVILAKTQQKDFGRDHKFIAVDPKTEEVWWDYFVFDGNTGAVKGEFRGQGRGRNLIGTPGAFSGEPCLGPDDSVIMAGTSIARYKRDGAPFPFSSTGSHFITIPNFRAVAGRNFTRGVHVDLEGNIYVAGSAGYKESKSSGYVRKYRSDGSLDSERLVEIDASMGGLAVDRVGGIYLGAHVKPHGQALPEYWAAFFESHPNKKQQHGYELAVGSVVKFTPMGGSVKLDSQGTDFQTCDNTFRKILTFKATGVEWSRMVYPIAKAHSGKCNCEVADFDIDGHNRLFVPDPLTYSVWVFDENGNRIARFGEYGNMDSRGPEIPISYAFRLAVSDKALYINDCGGQRVVKARLDYRETICINWDGSTVNEEGH